jgi:hypothetical protein
MLSRNDVEEYVEIGKSIVIARRAKKHPSMSGTPQTENKTIL